MQKERDIQIDILKGILIILLVVYHAGFDIAPYLSWFGIPLFFMMSGMFFNPGEVNSHQKIKAVFLSGALPYFCWLFLINMYDMALIIFSGGGFLNLLKYMALMLYGGRLSGGINTVFWFPACLLAVRIVSLLWPRKILNLYILFGLYLVSVLYSLFLTRTEINHSFCVPLNLDIVPIGLVYYGIGYHLKDVFCKTTPAGFSCAVLMIAVITGMNLAGYYHFEMDFKYIKFHDVVFTMLMPLLFMFFFNFLSGMIRGITYLTRILSYIGKNSMVIMYVHAPANIFLIYFTRLSYSSYWYLLIGLTASLITGYLISKSDFLSFHLAGKINQKRPMPSALSLAKFMIKPIMSMRTGGS